MVDGAKEANIRSKLCQRTANQMCRKKSFSGKEKNIGIGNQKFWQDIAEHNSSAKPELPKLLFQDKTTLEICRKSQTYETRALRLHLNL